MQPLDERAQEDLVESELARRGRLLEQGRADPHQRDRTLGDDRRRAARAAHVARLAEAVTLCEDADLAPSGARRHLPRDDDVEAVVELALADDLVAVGVVAPFARAQHLPDLRVRELVEEAQLAQLLELRLLVDAVRLRAQRMEDPRQRRRELEAGLESVLGLLSERR